MSDPNNDLESELKSFKKSLEVEDFISCTHQIEKLNLSEVAEMLGPKRTKEELIPYVYQAINVLPEKSVITLLTRLEEFVSPIDDSNIYILIDIFKKTFTGRYDTIIQTHKVVNKMVQNNALLRKHIILFIERLSQDEHDLVRMASVSLITNAHASVNEKSAFRLRKLFKYLLNDKTLLVKNTCIESLPKWIESLPENIINYEIASIVKHLICSVHEQFRKTAIELIVYIGTKTQNNMVRKEYVKSVIKLTTDRSWEIRQYVLENVINVMNFDYSKKTIMIYDEIFKSGISKIAIASFGEFCKKLYNSMKPNEFNIYFEKYIKEKIQIAMNDKLEIRSTMAKKFMDFCWIFKKESFEQLILPFIVDGLKDVKKNGFKESLIESFENMPDIDDWPVAICNVDKVFENLINTANDDWKIKRKIIVPIFQVSLKCGLEHFRSNVQKHYITLLRDENPYVFRTATLIFPALIKTMLSKDDVDTIYFLVFERTKLKITTFLMINELMFPTIDLPVKLDIKKYLGVFRLYKGNSQDTIKNKLKNISMLNNDIQKKLSSENIIHCSYDENKTEQKFYAGEILESLKKNLKQSIFHVNENEIQKIYLENVLEIIKLWFTKMKEPEANSNYKDHFLSNFKTFSDMIINGL